MSAAACAKKLLCDPDIHKAQAIANALEYLGKQVILNFNQDPTVLIEIKGNVSEAMKPHLEAAVKAGVEALGQ